jgi:uncharacterized protein (TIGR00106 family)
MIVEISIVPIGIGESLSGYIKDVVKAIEKWGLKYQLTPMGTIVEIDSFEELGKMLDEINTLLVNKGIPRIYTVIKADYRVKGTSMENKVRAVVEKLKSDKSKS